jgi:peptidoglycan/LPS O-acetylase OafA/YrhL
VLLHHFSAYLLPATGAAFAEATHFFLRGYLWVDFFFILSGFLLAYLYQDAIAGSARAYLTFLKTRFARTYPLHLFTLLAVLGLNLAMVSAEIRTNGLDAFWNARAADGLRFYGADTIATFFQHLFLLNSTHVGTHSSWNSPSWSIGAEWAAYVLFPLLIAPSVRFPRLTMVVCLPLTLWGAYSIERAFGGSLDVAGVFGTLRCLLEFWLGISLFRISRLPLAASLLRHDACVIASIAVAILTLHFDVPDTLAILSFAALILAGAQNRGAVSRLLESKPALWLGDISYSVYMTHWFVLLSVRWLWNGLRGQEFGASFSLPLAFASLAFVVAVVLGLSTLTWRYIEVPWRRRLRGPPTLGSASG